MGANEKHDATYHGGKYTPPKSHVRAAYTHCTRKEVGLDEAEAQFDRWLETVRAEAKAEAWEECARSIVYEDGTPVEIASISNPYK